MLPHALPASDATVCNAPTIQFKERFPYPKPTQVRVSTISAVSFLNADIDFRALYYALPLIPEDAPEHVLGVFCVKYYDKQYDEETRKKTITRYIRTCTSAGETEQVDVVDKYFQNQTTLIWRYRAECGTLKRTNGFVFNNGKVKGVGLKCNEDITNSFYALRDYLIIHLPLLRKDALKLVATRGIDDNGTTTDVSEEIRVVVHKRAQHTTQHPAATTTTTAVAKKPVGGLVPLLPPTSDLWLYGTRATMYNTDYSANFKINREALYHVVLDKYELHESEFEPDIYPAVKIKFAWNYDYLHGTTAHECTAGVCYCTKPCRGKGSGHGNGQCKVVTVCVFGNDAPKRHDAKVIITGANEYRQVEEVYAFINALLAREYETVFYREPYLVGGAAAAESVV